ncbi:MAG: 30S ribosomal protein S2 [Candidatus Liptonbacteria bacterium]|nr:30S ribosomal protein S2 [Candidatus Liptonbacteria bacterium]
MDTQLKELTAEQENFFPDESFREAIDAGVFYGRKKSKTNPKMKPFIFGDRGGIEILDLGKTVEGMKEAAAFIKERAAANALLLFVGTQPAAQELVLRVAKEFNYPFVTGRWIGGTLTNFKTIAKRIDHLKQLRSDMASGALEKYTKKERLQIDREINRLTELFGGLELLTRAPDALVVVDTTAHETAIREALRLHIPVVAFINSDASPDEVRYPVVGNNAARKSIAWFLEKIRAAVLEGRASAPQGLPPGENAKGPEKTAA